MASVTDYGGTSDTLSSPALGGASGWAAAVSAALNESDITVNDRISAVPMWNVTKPGRYAHGMVASATAQIMVAGSMRGPLYPVYREHSIDRIGVYCTVAGAAGSVIRLGIYRVDSNGCDMTLVLDAGTVDSTATGLLELTISQTLIPAMYWMCAVAQGAPATEPTIYQSSGATGAGWMLSSGTLVAGMDTYGGPFVTGVTGALSATVTNPSATGSIPRVGVRVA